MRDRPQKNAYRCTTVANDCEKKEIGYIENVIVGIQTTTNRKKTLTVTTPTMLHGMPKE